MAPPTFVAEYETVWNTGTTPKTSTPTVALDDILATGAIAEGDITFTAPTATGVTFTERQIVSVASHTEVGVWTGAITTAGSPTLSAASSSGALWWGHNTLRFSGTDGVGASAKTNSTGAPSLSITTLHNNSAIVVFVGDWAAVDGASRTWRTVNGTTPTAANGYEKSYFFDGSHYTLYAAYYPDAGTAGAKTVGLSAPAGQTYSIVAVEIRGSSATAVSGVDSGALTEGTTTLVRSSSVVDSGTLTDSSATSATVPATDTASMAESSALAQSLTVSDSASAAETAALAQSSSVTDSAALTETSVLDTGATPKSGTDSASLTESVTLLPAATSVDTGSLSEAAVLTVTGTTRWRLKMPAIRERVKIRGSLQVSIFREATVFGSDAGLFTSTEGVLSGGGDAYGAIPWNVKYLWHGGHDNTTTSTAIRDLWIANGFTVEEV